MSLRAFHIFFIVVAALFALFLAGWGYVRWQENPATGTLPLAVLSALAAVGLAVYGVRFVRTSKGIALLALILAAAPSAADACAVCFNPENEASKTGLNLAIAFLLAVTALVLGGLTVMICRLIRLRENP